MLWWYRRWHSFWWGWGTGPLLRPFFLQYTRWRCGGAPVGLLDLLAAVCGLLGVVGETADFEGLGGLEEGVELILRHVDLPVVHKLHAHTDHLFGVAILC